MNPPPAGTKIDWVRHLESAAQQIQRQLAQAQVTLASRGVDTPARLPAKLRAQPPHRVFRHDGLGLHFVLRDVAALPGHTCVFGPLNAEGGAVTFAEAVAFANQATVAWSQRLLAAQMPVEFKASDATELAREARQLAELYPPPPVNAAP